MAPIAGALMSAASASTTAGATIASASFADTILAAGVTSIWVAAMVNAGATVLDHLPHGSFFHATGGSMGMTVKERLKLIPYETIVGLVLTIGTIMISKLF
jgi:GntP family gluconate:H+ symporter